MKKEIWIAPKNSLILIMDRSIGEVPASMNRLLVAATLSCVAVGTLSEYDGKTLISMSDTSPPHDNLSLVFDGVLRTPTKKLSLCSVLNETLVDFVVSMENTRVRIWANDDMEPDQIHVVVS